MFTHYCFNLNLLLTSKTGGGGPPLIISRRAGRGYGVYGRSKLRDCGLAAWDMFGASQEAENLRNNYGFDFRIQDVSHRGRKHLTYLFT